MNEFSVGSLVFESTCRLHPVSWFDLKVCLRAEPVKIQRPGNVDRTCPQRGGAADKVRTFCPSGFGGIILKFTRSGWPVTTQSEDTGHYQEGDILKRQELKARDRDRGTKKRNYCDGRDVSWELELETIWYQMNIIAVLHEADLWPCRGYDDLTVIMASFNK